MKFYVDANNHCHTENIGGCIAAETPFFNEKCREVIEGYCYESTGDATAIYPWKPHSELAKIQAAVDRTQAEADEKQMELLNIIEELILEG